jgi:DNA primase
MTIRIERLKQAIQPPTFYATEFPTMKLPTRSGWVDGGLCPFHDDRNPGSWRVNTETGAFRCFSCGAAGGDIIDFVGQRYGLTFVEAIQKLADEWGVI